MRFPRSAGRLCRQANDVDTSREERPLDIRLANGEVVQFRCKALSDGGRLLTYGNVSDLVRRADLLEELASIDGMTGLNNRRNFLALAETEWARSMRYGRPLALLMLDIDLFKSVNDRYGHDVGDLVIKGGRQNPSGGKRSSDIAGRIGGEEFALMLPEATLDNACAAAKRIRQTIAQRALTVDGRSISFTISIGAGIAQPDVNGMVELMKQADVALYEAKRSGRNRVCTFDQSKAGDSQAAEKPASASLILAVRDCQVRAVTAPA